MPDRDETARPALYNELVPAVLAIALAIIALIHDGPKALPAALCFLVLGIPMGVWALLIRLRFSSTRFGFTIGPWRRYADLGSLESIRWKMTGAWRSRGTIFVKDKQGHTVPIYVGRFAKGDVWGPLLLDAANKCGAHVDKHSEKILKHHAPGGSFRGGAFDDGPGYE
jgi:hypothetical protein